MSKALATKKVAAVLLGFGMVLAFASTASAQTTSSTLSTLQAQVQALLAQIAALQGSGTATGSGGACFTFTLTEQFGSNGGQVMWVQEFLNGHGFTVAASGAGSPGNETAHFGALTRAAVAAFQKANGISPTAGYWGPLTRAKANAICAGSTTTTTTTTTPGAGVTVTAGVQPANSLAPMNATRVPFTTFTLTNNSGAAVTINGVTVQRTGLANDNAFAGVILLDSNGLQYGNSQTFNSNHQATVGGTFTLQAGQSMTFTVAGNMELSPGNSDGGQVASISVVGINTSVPVTGSLPITGAQQTINETLSIGKATVSLSGFDPNSHRSEPIGTTGLIFSGVRITAGSAEDEKLYSITWNQTGSAGSTDLANLSTVVNGTSYPVTVDASGKYYTSTFPGGILVTKGNSVDVYIKGDITGSSASGRTVEFDIYRSSDIYLVGQTFGYGIAPTTSLSGTNTSGANTSSGGSNTANPFYFGTYVSVTGGTLSTVSSASTVAPQNIGVNVPNQVLGGFSTNFTGEPVTVQSVQVDTATTTGALGLTNVTLVDSNGNVVAGPVDATYVSGGVGKILFNSSITFPVGPITYTIKGTVTSGSTNGSTYTLSTNPNTEWLSPVGQTSGTYVTLPATTITMSTMTVQPGQLTISAASSPASTNVTINQNNTTIANIVLDASQSGEDVRLNSLPIIVSATSTYGATILQTNLTNCQLYNGSTVLNSQSVGSSQWGVVSSPALANTGGELSTTGVEANFIFTNSLVVPKSTTVTLSLQCNIGGALPANMQFSAGVDTGYKPTVTGASSGNTITPTVNSGTSGTMTIGTASLSVTTPTQTYIQAAGGTAGVTLGSFTLQPTSGAVSLQNIGLKLNSNNASSSDLATGVVTIWNGGVQVGSANFIGKTPTGGFYFATSTISGVNLPQNVQTTLTLKADIATIGNGQSGTSGHELLVGLSDANGTSGNSQVDSGAGAQPAQGNGVAIFHTYPTQVSQSSLPTTGNADGRLIEFSVTANGANQLGIDQFVFKFASSTGVTITNPALYYGSAAGSENNLVENGVTNATSYTAAGAYATTTLATPLEVPATQTWFFVLKAASLSYSGSANTYSITTTLLGDGTDLAPRTIAGATATSSYDFVWSPNSTTTSQGISSDWTNGYGVNGLNSFGISQTRSN